jgi:hypothetical protein
MNDPLGLFGDDKGGESSNNDPLGLFADEGVQQEEPGLFDFLTGSARKGFKQAPLANVLQQGAQGAPGALETGAMLITGAAGQAGAPVAAGLKALNDITQGREGQFGTDFGQAMENMTYNPRTEMGQEMGQAVGEAMNRYLVPIAPMMFAPAAGSMSRAATPKAPKPKKVKGGDASSAAAEFTKKGQALDVDLSEGPGLGKTLFADERGVVTPELPDANIQRAKRNLMDDTTGPPLHDMIELQKQADAMKAQEVLDARQKNMEIDVKRQQTLDFNAAERARQEAAPIPGLENTRQEAAYADVIQKVDTHPLVKAAEERLTKAEELLIKASERAEPAQIKRIERDIKHLQESVEHVRANVEDGLLRNKKTITSSGKFSRQRGAINPGVFKEGFEKIKALAGDTHLRASNKGGVLYIEALKDGKVIGETQFNPKYDMSREKGHPKYLEQDLMSDWTFVKPDERGGSLAREMYNFAAELGNDIRASDIQTESGKAMWDKFERHGKAYEGEWLRDPEIKTRKASSAETSLKSLLSADAKTHIGGIGGGPAPIGPGRRQGGWILLEGKKKNAMNKLADKIGIDKHLGELAPSQWTPEQAVEFAKGAKDVDQNFVQNALNMFTKGGLYQTLKTHNPVVRYVTENFLKADQLARADIRDMVHAKLAPAMRALDKKEQANIWAMLNLADIQQKPLDLELLARHGFNEKQLKLVEEHRAVMDYAFEQINKARDAAGKPPIDKRTAYAAMRSTGDYRRLVYDVKGGDVIGVLGSNFRHKVNSLKKDMEGKGFFVGEERYFGGVPRERGSANQAFMQAIEFLADNDPRVQGFIDVLDEIRTQETYNFLNAKTHTQKKKGVDGMEGRKSWQNAEDNALDGLQAQLNYAETAIKWGHLSDAAANVKKVLDNPEVNMPKAKQWSEDYMYNALGFNPSRFGRAAEEAVARLFQDTGVGYSVARKGMAMARKTANTVLLGLNPAFWSTQVVQPMAAMPGMKAYLIAKGLDAGFDFGTGWSYLAEGSITASKERAHVPLNAFEKKAKSYAEKHHVYGSDLVEHSNRARKGIGTTLDGVGNMVTGAVESASRRVMFYGFAHLLKENGMKIENGLFETAQNLTDMALNNYSAVERPQLYNKLGPVGDLAVNLQSFKHNELSRIAMFARQIKEEKSARPILAQLTAGVAVAGITGTLGFAEADQLYKYITKLMGKPDSLTAMVIRMSEDTAEKAGVPSAKHVLSHGGFSMMGLDMSKRLGLSDIIPNTMTDAIFPGGSKLAEIGAAGYEAVKNPTEMNAKRFAREAAPGVATGAIDRAWFSKDTPEGELSVRPRDLKGQAYRNESDKTWRSLGFMGMNESIQRQKVFEVENEARAYTELRMKPLNKMRDEIFSKGKVSSDTVQKYIALRGNVNTLEGDLLRYFREQNMSAKDMAMMKATATTSVANIEKAKDYFEMFKE